MRGISVIFPLASTSIRTHPMKPVPYSTEDDGELGVWVHGREVMEPVTFYQ